MKLHDLDTEDIRDLMIEEIELDINNGGPYISKNLKSGYENTYTTLLKEAAVNGDTGSLARCIQNDGCLLTMKNGKSVRRDAHTMLAEGEFNRYYIRALCRKAISDGYELEVCRVKEVGTPRPGSEALIGTKVNPHQLLEDLRGNVGVETALRIPGGPNSGISVKLKK
ncbi:MAG: hypothetical protein ACLQG5_06870 [Methanobacterium sp.]|jgi:hypothetical protein